MVCTYGRIARMAGRPTGARQVARILHSMSRRHQLPWHRVVNHEGTISLPTGRGFETQKVLLQSEGVAFDHRGGVDLRHYLWSGG
jgi:methylated-DNA-protein-cysteine methyltransferase-like protein